MQLAPVRPRANRKRMQTTNDRPVLSRVSEVTVVARDGLALAGRLYLPPGEPEAAVVLLSGAAIPQSFYSRFATYLSDRAIAVLTFDYRGIGRSRHEPLRKVRATMTEWAQRDIDGALGWLKERYPSLPRVAIAHSFGGQALGLAPSAIEAVDRAVLIASGSGFVGHYPFPVRLRNVAVFGALLPAAAATIGYWPKDLGLGDGLPGGVAREWARWCRAPGYLTSYVPPSQRFHAQLSIPLLALGIADDDYAPPLAVDALLSWYGSASIDRREISPDAVGVPVIGHFGFFRETAGAKLWPDVVRFVRG